MVFLCLKTNINLINITIMKKIDEDEMIFDFLSSDWFAFCFENPEKIKPAHSALYYFIITNYCRLRLREKIALRSCEVMKAVGIRSYKTYVNTLNDLIGFGFIDMVQRSSNQYTANIIRLSFTNQESSIIKQDYLDYVFFNRIKESGNKKRS